MTVLAFSTPRYPGEWRWRIVEYSADNVIEESTVVFPTLVGALAAGQLRVSQINTSERGQSRPLSRSVAFSRSR